MSNGLKNIQLHARAYARKERLGSGLQHPGYDDDSGVSVVGVPDMEVPEMDDSQDGAYSSPGSTNSQNGSGNSTAGQASFTSVMPSQDSYHQGYGYAQAHHHGYTSSVSSSGTASYVATGDHHGGHGASPYLDHSGRLPGVSNIGIEHIINPRTSGV